MRRHGSSVLNRPSRATTKFVLVLLAVAIVVPTVVFAGPKKKQPSIPSCTRLPTKTMAKLLGTGPLKRIHRTANLCSWKGTKSGHYGQLLGIDIIPGIKSIYATAESDGKAAAAKNGDSFGTLSSRHNPWKAAFFVTGTMTDAGLPPCSAKHKRPPFGPPKCSGDPEWTTFNVDSYDSKLMVSVGIAAQQGDVQLSHVIELNKEILSGKIR